ncbi:DUF3373 family protein [Thermosulfurimonas sp. F29]|uniref:DUF3373 family protein n=1 Tax=Thermosulfurimonas sp. F29 TaxID=2867247 RepID=UPI001C828343|nr:DUF3373 family protein [Thermosulfurimonas sp. F29]MBX6423685.1 DUF3373 family protein [Thermosulfurimonas sp. F29]
MKRWLGLFLAFLLMVPMVPGGLRAYTGVSQEELLQKIEQLEKELQALKKQLQEVKQAQEETSDTVDEMSDLVEKFKDNAGKFKIWGDIRTRIDSTRAYVPANHYMFTYVPTFAQMPNGMRNLLNGYGFVAVGGMLNQTFQALLPALQADPNAADLLRQMNDLPTSVRNSLMNMRLVDMVGHPIIDNSGNIIGWDGGIQMPVDERTVNALARAARKQHRENDTIWTNRMRINFKVNPTENTNVKVRLSYYKVWGMSNDYIAPGLFPPQSSNFSFGVRPSDSRLYVDRAYFNWVNVGGYPIWISFGRRPTTHGSPQHLREGLDKKEASPSGINIDIPFDGATLGFQYRWPWPGRIRFCYGRGFESGFKLPIDRAKDDVDFYGFVWDVLDDPDRNMMLIVQAFKAEGVMDFPDGEWYMFNPVFNAWMPFAVTTQNNLGDIYELGATWIHKVDIPYLGLEGVDYFVSVGVSITDPDDWGYMGIPIDHNGNYLMMYYSLLEGPYLTLANPANGIQPGDLWNPKDAGLDLDTHTGWAVYVGARIPLPWVPGAKLGLEYNYGSKWWLPFMVATDDIYFNKLATRGHVAEVYWIQDLPAGEALSKYARVFLRLGFQYYWFNYTGSGVWLGRPYAIKGDLDDTDSVTMFQPIDHMYNFYASFEVYF